MKCPACGGEVPEGSKTCAKCGKELSLGDRAVSGTEQIAKDTGVVAGKIGRAGVLGAKGFVSGMKKGLKGEGAEQKDSAATEKKS